MSSASSRSSSSSGPNNRFADYFVITGLDLNSGLEPDSGDNLQSTPLDRSYKSQVLAHYPDNVPWNPFDKDAVSMLCLPHGLQFRTQKHPREPRFHSFVITRQDGSRTYGFSQVFFEEMQERKICNAMQTLQAMHLTELSGGPAVGTRSLPRHFKLSARRPGAAPGYFDAAHDKLFVSKSIALLCQLPFVHAAQQFLFGLLACSLSARDLSLESHVHHLLYKVQVPTPGQSISFNCWDRPVLLQRPCLAEELPLFDFPMQEMFALLGVDAVIQLFTCVLLENQVLLVSADYQRLMVVAESIVALLFPFAWQHVYVPVLPASMQHFLDAPVPFIMGLHGCESNEKVGSQANLCCVDVDAGSVQLPEELPDFPARDMLAADLTQLADGFGVRRGEGHRSRSTHSTLPRRKHSWSRERRGSPIAPRQPPRHDRYLQQTRFNRAVREVFLDRFVRVFSTYERCVLKPDQGREDWLSDRDSMQNFDKATFLSDQPQSHLPFLSRFIESQMFATLIDNKVMSAWDETEPNLLVFDRRIKLARKSGGHSTGDESKRLLEERLSSPDIIVSPPGEVLRGSPTGANDRGFPLLDSVVLNQASARSEPRASSLSRRRGTAGHQRQKKDDAGPPPKSGAPVMSPADLAHTNWSFVEKLLKDCKGKTKKMLVHKMGQEAVELGHGGEVSVGVVEENTLIAGLCDLLERVWSHGLQNKQGKSALWCHLMKWLPQAPSELAEDLRNVQAMQGIQIRSEAGLARAWVRLSLEKKLLSRHLQSLTSDSALLRSLYKRSAFLRCQDEREQFLYHLLTLNAVDYSCFTSSYPGARMCYRCELFLSRKTTTSANCWLAVSGTLGETTELAIPRGALELVFYHKNLGLLTSLRLGHDNSGLSPRWLVDHVTVANQVTSRAYRFPCGRWIGRGLADGCLERLLVPAAIPSPAAAQTSVADIQQMLGQAVNDIVKLLYQPSADHSSLTILLCGERGLVSCLEQVFLVGFKSTRLFGRNLYVWDFFVRVKEEFEADLAAESVMHTEVMGCYCQLLDQIASSSHALGKDGKFQLFVCLGARERLLHRMLPSLAESRSAAQLYDECSFLRDPALLIFLVEILESLDEFDIVLENSITQGIAQ